MSAVGWFERVYWTYKVLGVSLCAALSASTLTTVFGNSYLAAPSREADQLPAESEPAEDEDDPEAAPGPAAAPVAVDRTATIERIVAHNLFCPSCAKVEPRPPEADPPSGLSGARPVNVADLAGARPCTLPLRLVATMEAGLTSWATIRDAENGSVGPFEPDEFVRPGVSLASVERGRVYLWHQDVLEVLELGVEPPPPPKQPVTKKSLAEDTPIIKEKLPGLADGVRCDSASSCTISREFVDSLFGNPAKLMGQARVAPAVRDGETRGFEFRGVKRDSLPQVLGIANGDIITSVNGNNLQSIDQVMGLVTKLRRASNLSITLERKGVAITKDFEIR
jgi:hypothetical protein